MHSVGRKWGHQSGTRKAGGQQPGIASGGFFHFAAVSPQNHPPPLGVFFVGPPPGQCEILGTNPPHGRVSTTDKPSAINTKKAAPAPRLSTRKSEDSPGRFPGGNCQRNLFVYKTLFEHTVGFPERAAVFNLGVFPPNTAQHHGQQNLPPRFF